MHEQVLLTIPEPQTGGCVTLLQGLHLTPLYLISPQICVCCPNTLVGMPFQTRSEPAGGRISHLYTSLDGHLKNSTIVGAGWQGLV